MYQKRASKQLKFDWFQVRQFQFVKRFILFSSFDFSILYDFSVAFSDAIA